MLQHVHVAVGLPEISQEKEGTKLKLANLTVRHCALASSLPGGADRREVGHRHGRRGSCQDEQRLSAIDELARADLQEHAVLRCNARCLKIQFN
jgi:hypothetical protein